jgi:hypothetical protein
MSALTFGLPAAPMPTLLRDLITIPEHVSKGDFVLKLADKFPLVVPPIFDKSTLLTHESLQGMWFTGTNALNEAQQVYIVGYSMPPSDRAMVHFLQEAIHPGARVEVVSKDPELYKRFRDTLLSWTASYPTNLPVRTQSSDWQSTSLVV